MTFICVSIMVEEAGGYEALTHARAAADQGADLIEWRIDQVGDDLELVRHLVCESPRPCIVTCRPRSEGGRFAGSESDRLGILTTLAGEGGMRYLDLELTDDVERSALLRRACQADTGVDSSTRLIISTHDFERRPADLYRRVGRLASDESCNVAKLVWQGRSLRDNLQAFEVLRERTKPTIALCMGGFGLMSRVLAPKFGGFLTFAAVDSETQTAPGQPSLDELIGLYRFRKIVKTTKVYGIIGWPVEHSLSPFLHNAGFDEIGFDGVYLPMPIAAEYEHFKATLSAFLDDEHLGFRGASVTLPHKEHLLRFAKGWSGAVRIADVVQEVGAANTINVTSGGVLEITNTDGLGLLDSLANRLEIDRKDFEGLRVAVVGAGGAARSAVACLTNFGATVRIFNRTAAHARTLAEEFAARPRGVDGAVRNVRAALKIDEIEQFEFEVCINTTPVGMFGGPDHTGLPIPTGVFAKGRRNPATLFFDTVYAPAETPFLTAAAAGGFRTLGGLEMLVRQAAGQFKIWTGRMPDISGWLEAAGGQQRR